MKYVITGGAGNISHAIVEQLLKAGHSVTVIGRNEANLKNLVGLGAIAAIGSVEDVAFLTRTFTGADAVYTMVPPNFGAADIKQFIGQIGKNYAAAINAAGVKYVVNLSSVGAHLSAGCGPVTGLHHGELALNELAGVNIKHLRPSYFYYNLLANVGMVKHLGIIGSNFEIADGRFPIVDPADIAVAATEELVNLDFKGHSIRYIASDETGTDEIASLIGNAIGKPDLKWVVFSDQQALDGMVQAGLPQNIAENYVEMGQALNSGKMLEDYWNHPSTLAKKKIEDFAKEFAAAYNSN